MAGFSYLFREAPEAAKKLYPLDCSVGSGRDIYGESRLSSQQLGQLSDSWAGERLHSDPPTRSDF